MNQSSNCCDQARVAAYALAVAGTFLIVAGLVWAMHRYTQPASVGANRAKERSRNLADLKGAEQETLNNYGVEKPDKGIVRLPIQEAMKITVTEWKNPAAARSNLIARVAKANEAPPKPPEKPSQFE